MNTPTAHFFNFLHSNEEELARLTTVYLKELKEVGGETPQPVERIAALNKLAPDWKSLKNRPEAKALCESVLKWAKKWHLTDEWCLDFALEVLKSVKLDFADNVIVDWESDTDISLQYREFDEECQAWRNALFDRYFQNPALLLTIPRNERYAPFKFKWKPIEVEDKDKVEKDEDKDKPEGFEIEVIYRPDLSLREKFLADAETQFWARFFKMFRRNQLAMTGRMGEVIANIRTFQKSLKSYVKKNEAHYASKLIAVHEKKSSETHYHWLIEYQLSDKSFAQIGESNRVEGKTVEYAVKSVSETIGLTVRKSLNVGRPKGSKDKSPRRRVT